MTKVIAHMTMSLDGFIADPNDGVEELFGWYDNGDVTVPTNDPRWVHHATPPSAEMLREGYATVGALVCGRRLFDYTHGWGGNHPTGVPLFVLTHRPPTDWPHPVTFVTDGVESAIMQAKGAAGDKFVAIASTTVAQQALDAGVLDEIVVSLVPVLLGKGIPFFANLASAPVRLSDPEVIEGTQVTHLRYQVTKPR
jgi:dihydrofolate reductase